MLRGGDCSPPQGGEGLGVRLFIGSHNGRAHDGQTILRNDIVDGGAAFANRVYIWLYHLVFYGGQKSTTEYDTFLAE